MKRLLSMLVGVALLALVVSFPQAQEGARPEKNNDGVKRQANDAKPDAGKPRILKGQVVQFKHVEAAMARELLMKEFPDEFTEESRTDVNDKHNSLVFTAPPEMIPQVLDLLREFDEAVAAADDPAAGAEGARRRNVYRAIDACLPHDRTMHEQEEDDPTLKQRIRILRITLQKTDDLGDWYGGLRDYEKRFMRSDDRASGPSGAGYVVTLQGRHSHREPNNPRMHGLSYVDNTLLRNLKHWTIPEFDVALLQPTGKFIPVRQMGITHPTITASEPIKMVAFQPTAAQTADNQPARKIPICDFTIQFAWKDIPAAERKAVDPHEKEVAAELAAKEDFRPDLPAENTVSGTADAPTGAQREPGVSDEELKIFSLKQADASASRDLVLAMYPAEFMNRSKIAADVRTNSLVVRGSRDFLATIEAVLISLDEKEATERPTGKAAGEGRDSGDGGTGKGSFPRPGVGARWLQSLQMAANPESEVQGVQQEYRRLEQKAAELAGQYRQAQEAAAAKGLPKSNDPAAAKLKAALEQTVEAAFDARQKIQSYELEQLRQRLSRIESRVTMRDRVKEEIVRQRVEELLHPERSWEPGDEAGDSPAVADPTAGTAKNDAPRPRDAAAKADYAVWTTDIAAAKAEAASSGRLLLLYFRPKPSASQQEQERDMAGSSSLQKVLRHFVLVAIDISDAANLQVMGEYTIGEKPKIVVTDADGQPRYATEKDSFRDRWQLDELRQDLTGIVRRYETEQAESARDETGRGTAEASPSAKSGRNGAAMLPEDGKNPRDALVDAEWSIAAARSAVTAAEKNRDFSQTDLKRVSELHRTGAVSDREVRKAEKQAGEDDARLEKAKLDLEHAERLAKLARENLESRLKLVELDMVDAKLRIDHLSAEEAQARRLLESKAIAKAEYDKSKLTLERARLQLGRLKELMELYAKPIPGTEVRDAGEGTGEPPGPRGKKNQDAGAVPRKN